MDLSTLSPGMVQYMGVKNQHPDCIVLFRMGDFYETFYDDAKLVAKELEITLTARGKGESRAPLAGIPYHALEPYLAKLVKRGHKVAIVEQLEDPKTTKKLVKRGLVRIVTPGTLIESSMLTPGVNNFIVSIMSHGDNFGIAIIDISTGEFLVTEIEGEDKFVGEILRIAPAEMIVPQSLLVNKELIKKLPTPLFPFENQQYEEGRAVSTLQSHFDVLSLNGFGLSSRPFATQAAGALLAYLHETQKNALLHINSLRYYSLHEYMNLDVSTERNLELISNVMTQSKEGTSISILDRTSTSLGARLLRKFILRPLLDKVEIQNRLDAVEELVNNSLLRVELTTLLSSMHDLERLLSRVSYGTASPRDLVALYQSLQLLPAITKQLCQARSFLLRTLSSFPNLSDIELLLFRSIRLDPPLLLREGGVIKDEYNSDLDDLRTMQKKSKDWVVSLEAQERAKTGIKNLRVGFTSVFGYYFSVSPSNIHLVPSYYIRKQTLVNEERYITPELKEEETAILTAEEKSISLEQELYSAILETVKLKISEIKIVAANIASIDVIASFATVSLSRSYTRPLFVEENCLILKESRHPVIETMGPFIPNDCLFDKSTRVHIITGPNMSGKSTVMRQIALIQLMAQIGCYVPARYATLSICDKIFSRVGAYDDLTHGQSTFMVEMTETANILHNATEKSLVILDEIGRGTSTYDGISLAWAIAEYLQVVRAKTLFATHYHQMNKLSEKFATIKNYNIAIKETDDEIIFLRKIVEGGTDKSYGIQVAKLAGVPQSVIDRSKAIMNRLEMEDEIADRIHTELPKREVKKEKKEVRMIKGKQLRLDEM